MQHLLSAPREAFSETRIREILNATTLYVRGGLQIVKGTYPYAIEDISDDLIGGSVDYHCDAEGAHGTVSLEITRELEWGRVKVRPYVELFDKPFKDAGLSPVPRFYLGVYVLTTPSRVVGANVERTVRDFSKPVYSVTGYDLLYRLDRPIGDTYQVTAGDGRTYPQAVRETLEAAGITDGIVGGVASSALIQKDRVWPFLGESGSVETTTWLQVINELLQAINYEKLWFDHNGLPNSRDNLDPYYKGAEWSFDTSNKKTTLVGEERQSEEDLWNVPNVWRFINTNASNPIDGRGIFTRSTPANDPTSSDPTYGVGFPNVRVVQVAVADQSELEAYAYRQIATDRRLAHRISIKTSPFPLASQNDVALYTDPELSPTAYKVQASHWTMSLTGDDSTYDFDVVKEPIT